MEGWMVTQAYSTLENRGQNDGHAILQSNLPVNSNNIERICMKIVKASHEVIAATDCLEQVIELAGRTCYKSEDKICEGSAEKFVSKIRSLNHESVLEHGAITVRFICDRGVSHELVRHRLASFSQESTRYCNYSDDKFGNELTFIDIRDHVDYNQYKSWRIALECAQTIYFQMVNAGCTAQIARSILPNSLKTEVIVTANPREWRHIFKMRCAQAAHPQMRELMIPCRDDFANRWPSLFADL